MNEVTSSQSDNTIGVLSNFTPPKDVPVYSLLDENDIVVNTILAYPDFIETLPNSASYVLAHDPEYPTRTKGGIGTIYDRVNKVFVYPQPFPSWTLDENFNWIPPVPFPTEEGDYDWDEESLSWKRI